MAENEAGELICGLGREKKEHHGRPFILVLTCTKLRRIGTSRVELLTM